MSDREPAPQHTSWRAHGLALLVFLAAGLALLHPALFGGQVLWAGADFVRQGPFPAALRQRAPPAVDALSDQVQQFVPWLRFAAEGLRQDGTLPLWKDTAGAGAPLIGNGQSAVFYPTNLLAILVGAPPVMLAVQALLKFVAGAAGAWLLARHLRRSVAASILCGLVFGFGGFQVAWHLHPHTSVSLLLPLSVLLADRLVLRPSIRRAALLAAVAGLQHLGGHPETAFHCQVLVLGLGVARAVSLRTEFGGRAAWSRVAWLGSALGIGLALAAIQVVPVLEYVARSELLGRRSTETVAAPPAFWASAGFGLAVVLAVLALRRMASLERSPALAALGLGCATLGGVLAGLSAGLQPGFVMTLACDWFGPPTQYLGPQYYLEQAGAFIGAAFPLAVLGALAGSPRGVVRTAGCVAGLGLLAGFRAPLVSDVLQRLPLFDLALNERLQLFALLATAVLAAFGLDSLDALRRPGARLRLALASCVPPLAAFAGLALAVQLGAVESENAPARSQGTGLVEAHLMPAEQLHALFTGESPLAGADGKTMCGYVVTPQAAAAIGLLYGREGRVAKAQWKLAPGSERALETGESRRAYVFRAVVPGAGQPRERTRVRVQVELADGTLAVSGRLTSPDDDPGTRLPFPARPASGAATALGLSLIVAVLALLLLPAGARGMPVRLLACLALVVASLAGFARPLIPLVPAELFYPPSPLFTALAAAPPDGRIAVVEPAFLGAEILTFYGIPDARGYDALQPARVAQLFDRATRDPRHPDGPLLGLMAVKLLADPDAARRRLDEPQAGIAENPGFLPRARLVGGAEIESDDERALERLCDPAFPRATTAILAAGAPSAAPAGGIGAASIRSSRPDRVSVEIEATAPGWLVLSDTDFPGWIATVDGRPREIVRANLAFRAVRVASGERVVEFRYAPLSFRLGAATSGLTLLLLLGACWRSRRA